MTLKKSEEAISPVIGVMLMLAVTLIIAVAVVTISTGLATDTKTAPNAVLEVEIDRCVVVFPPYEDGSAGLFGPDLSITHISGDPLPTSELELHFSWTHDVVDGGGNTVECSHSSKYDTSLRSTTSWGSKVVPMYMKFTSTSSSHPWGVDFGTKDAVLTSGKKIFTHSDFLYSDYYSVDATVNFGSEFMDTVLGNDEFKSSTMGYSSADDGIYYYYPPEIYNAYRPHSDGACPVVIGAVGGIIDHLPEGTPINVKIIHSPSNKPIYNKVVHVKETYKFVEEEY